MAKERWTSGGDARTDPGVGTSLDELAKGLATGAISRHKAIRLMGGALVGGMLVSVPGMAWAKPKPGKCKPGTPCPNGTRCLPNAHGGGGTCPCGGFCTTSCAACGPSQVCVQAGSSVCADLSPFACVTPCPSA
jgi:hypothetical protein